LLDKFNVQPCQPATLQTQCSTAVLICEQAYSVSFSDIQHACANVKWARPSPARHERCHGGSNICLITVLSYLELSNACSIGVEDTPASYTNALHTRAWRDSDR